MRYLILVLILLNAGCGKEEDPTAAIEASLADRPVTLQPFMDADGVTWIRTGVDALIYQGGITKDAMSVTLSCRHSDPRVSGLEICACMNSNHEMLIVKSTKTFLDAHSYKCECPEPAAAIGAYIYCQGT